MTRAFDIAMELICIDRFLNCIEYDKLVASSRFLLRQVTMAGWLPLAELRRHHRMQRALDLAASHICNGKDRFLNYIDRYQLMCASWSIRDTVYDSIYQLIRDTVYDSIFGDGLDWVEEEMAADSDSSRASESSTETRLWNARFFHQE